MNKPTQQQIIWIDEVLATIRESCILSIEKDGYIDFKCDKVGLSQQYLTTEEKVWVDDGSRRFIIDIKNPFENPKLAQP